MPVWGEPLRKQLTGGVRSVSRLTRVARAASPQRAISTVLRTLLGSAIGALVLPIVNMVIPLIQAGIKAYIEAEIRRKFEEQRSALYKELSAAMKEEDRQLYRELVPE